jgi:hypothetical protein
MILLNSSETTHRAQALDGSFMYQLSPIQDFKDLKWKNAYSVEQDTQAPL